MTRRTSTFRTAVVWIAPVLALTLVSACGSTRSAEDAPRTPEAREKALGDRLALRDPRTGNERGLAFLELTLVNPTGDRVTGRCAPEWYDAQGALVSAAADWQTIDLKPSQERRMRFAPMPAAAKSWRLRFGT